MQQGKTGGIEVCAAKKHLAGYKVPKLVFFYNRLPRNVMGKVEKARLREIHHDAFAGQA